MANNAPFAPVPLIMTRPRSASEAFVSSLPAPVRARINSVFSPLIRVVPLTPPLTIGPKDSAVFSSANGVEAAPDGQGRTAYCIGSATTSAAKARGWTAERVGKDADELVAALQAIQPAHRLVHLSGVHTRGDIAGRLSQAGLNIGHTALYDQQLCPLTDAATRIIATAARVVVPLFSQRTAAQFVNVAPSLASVHAIALSPAIARELSALSVASLTVAAHPDAQAMGAALANMIEWN